MAFKCEGLVLEYGIVLVDVEGGVDGESHSQNAVGSRVCDEGVVLCLRVCLSAVMTVGKKRAAVPLQRQLTVADGGVGTTVDVPIDEERVVDYAVALLCVGDGDDGVGCAVGESTVVECEGQLIFDNGIAGCAVGDLMYCEMQYGR